MIWDQYFCRPRSPGHGTQNTKNVYDEEGNDEGDEISSNLVTNYDKKKVSENLRIAVGKSNNTVITRSRRENVRSSKKISKLQI